MRILQALFPFLLALAASAPAAAEYPERPLRIIVPFAAGGPSDTAARHVGQVLARSLGQPVVVENKPGADGAIAAQTAKAAPADGYTLFWCTGGVAALAQSATPAAFDPLTDFAPVASVGSFAFGLYVHPDVPSRSLREFVEHARARPGELNFAAVNIAEHSLADQFMQATGVSMVRIPYKGFAQVAPDLASGRVQATFSPVGGGLPLVKDGRLRMLAVVGPERTPLAPEVPTFAEAGIPGITVDSRQMILVPARTPAAVIDRLSREVNAALRTAEVRAGFEKLALVPQGGTPAELTAALEEAQRRWQRYFRAVGVAAR